MEENKELNYQDWLDHRLSNNEYLSTYSNDILSKPKVVVNATTEGLIEPLYSHEQMLEMFRMGFRAMENTDFGRDVIRKKNKRFESPYYMMRNMRIGQVLVFPYSKWSATRSAASRLKSEFGSLFKVNKLTTVNSTGDIRVIRLS